MNTLQDPLLTTLIAAEKERQIKTLNLIASENFISPQVAAVTGSILSNKYAEGLPGRRYYGGCEVVDEIESLAIDRVKSLFGAVWANVQPHSGSQANAAVMLATLKAGDKILGFNLNHGGHLTHGSKVNFSGILYQSLFYGLKKETGRVDMEEVARIAMEEKPRLIICGASSYSRDWDYAHFRAIADEVGAFLLADIAHPAGLIAHGLLKDPISHCHFITSTTHKTLRGARGGLIMMGQDFENPLGIKDRKGRYKPMSALLDSAVFPGLQGGPLENQIGGKAVAFHEASTAIYGAYVKQVQENSNLLANAFIKKGYQLISGGTDNHLFLIDLTNMGLTGKEAEKILGKAGIIVNKNMTPFDTKSPFVTSGIRLGSPAITTRGLTSKDMAQVADWVDTVLKNKDEKTILAEVKKAVKAKMSILPLFNVKGGI